jgi:hypothetical protein
VRWGLKHTCPTRRLAPRQPDSDSATRQSARRLLPDDRETHQIKPGFLDHKVLNAAEDEGLEAA